MYSTCVLYFSKPLRLRDYFSKQAKLLFVCTVYMHMNNMLPMHVICLIASFFLFFPFLFFLSIYIVLIYMYMQVIFHVHTHTHTHTHLGVIRWSGEEVQQSLHHPRAIGLPGMDPGRDHHTPLGLGGEGEGGRGGRGEGGEGGGEGEGKEERGEEGRRRKGEGEGFQLSNPQGTT